MINDYPEVKGEIEYSMAEFFVMYKYRRVGIVRYAALEIFNRFKGRWQLKRHPKNQDPVMFWDRIIDEVPRGDYQLIQGHKDAQYDDGTFGDMFLFNNHISKN